MYLKLTMRNGVAIRVNMDMMEAYKEAFDQKGGSDIWQLGEDSTPIQVLEPPQLIDTMLALRTPPPPEATDE